MGWPRRAAARRGLDWALSVIFSERRLLHRREGCRGAVGRYGEGTAHTALHSHTQPEAAAVRLAAGRRPVRAADREAHQTVTGACSTCSSQIVPDMVVTAVRVRFFALIWSFGWVARRAAPIGVQAPAVVAQLMCPCVPRRRTRARRPGAVACPAYLTSQPRSNQGNAATQSRAPHSGPVPCCHAMAQAGNII
eukprot:COSAG06_NODE_443_length_15706_cov_348.207022_8_plen_193_part_00